MAFDPENIVLTNVGRDYLVARKAAGQPARIGSYRLGSTNLFTPTVNDVAIHGTQTYIGLADEIWHNKYTDKEVIIRCICDPENGDFDIGNIGIYADTGVLLFIAKFPYIHRKMKSNTTVDKEEAGGRWTFQLRLMQDDLYTRWNFDNLVTRYAEMNEYIISDPATPRYPLDSFYTEMQLNDSFLPTNRQGYILISGDVSRKWFTSPFQMSEAYNIVYERYELDGGVTGDRHTGIF